MCDEPEREVQAILARLRAAGFVAQWTPPSRPSDQTHKIIVSKDGRCWGIWSPDPVSSAREISRQVQEA
ncbi:MAG: hypothetical protein AMXMBFR13_20660 [Phycisphaerae bacterium]